MEQASQLFEGKRGSKPVNEHSEPERLYSAIGKLKMELDWLKKVRTEPAVKRLTWIEGKALHQVTAELCECIQRTTSDPASIELTRRARMAVGVTSR